MAVSDMQVFQSDTQDHTIAHRFKSMLDLSLTPVLSKIYKQAVRSALQIECLKHANDCTRMIDSAYLIYSLKGLIMHIDKSFTPGLALQ